MSNMISNNMFSIAGLHTTNVSSTTRFILH